MHETNKKICLMSFYKFKKISNPIILKNNIKNLKKKNNFFGTILISKEGINGTIAGYSDCIQDFQKFLNINLSESFSLKTQFINHIPFKKFKLKVKEQIIKIGNFNVEPEKSTGEFLTPKKWDEFLHNDNTVVIDTRNFYESNIGSFKNSIFPMTTSFSEFPKWFKKNKHKFKNKNILTYCTGGIRCEKATSYIKKIGFKRVYQLEGGILNYFKKVKENDSNFEGECFVFDDRVSVNHSLNKGAFGICYACGQPITKVDFMSKFYKKGISCDNCYFKTTEEQKKKFRDRQNQYSSKNK